MSSRTQTRAQRAASAYLSRGWCAIPVPYGSKNPGREGWTEWRYEPADVERVFAGQINIGIHCGVPSAGLVCVDLDTRSARELAPLFLPDTERKHGRKSSPASHWWYVTDPIPERSSKYQLPAARTGEKRRTLIELLSTGRQAIVPPSLHGDSREEYTWDATGDPSSIDGRILRHQVERLAACVLLSEYWDEGVRHDLALAVAGTLLRHGWDGDSAWEFVEAASRAAGDIEQLSEHRHAVYDTLDALDRDDPATGIPTLVDLLTEPVARLFLRWLGISQPRTRLVVDQVAKPTNGRHPPEIEMVDEGEADEPVWQMPKGAPHIDPARLPYWLERIYRHIQPLTIMFPAEWPVMMTLPFWSILWPDIRIQNLNLGIWSLGIGRQGGGKNLGTDELQHLFRACAGVDVKLYTAGSPEGLWEALEGTGKRVIAYHDEYAGLLKLFSRDHMSHAREALCSLYDMRGVGYLRSKGKSVQIIDPFIAVVATTTASALREHGNVADLTNGYLSRFMICAPDRRNVSPDFSRAHEAERQQLARELALFRNELAGVDRVEYAETGRKDPPIIDAYREHLGMDTGEIERLEDSLDDTTIPGGRLLARVKKIAALLALAEFQPERRGNSGVVLATSEHIQMAIDLTELGYFYAERVLRWIGASDEVQLSDRILSLLRENEFGLTRRQLCRKTKRRAAEVQDALRLLREEGTADVVRDSNSKRGERWFAVRASR